MYVYIGALLTTSVIKTKLSLALSHQSDCELYWKESKHNDWHMDCLLSWIKSIWLSLIWSLNTSSFFVSCSLMLGPLHLMLVCVCLHTPYFVYMQPILACGCRLCPILYSIKDYNGNVVCVIWWRYSHMKKKVHPLSILWFFASGHNKKKHLVLNRSYS